MLANQYFIARNFQKAIPLLENELQINTDNLKLKKRLIICLSQVGRFKDCLQLFLETIDKDPFEIINTDIYSEDCPCPKITDDLKKHWNSEISTDYYNILGVLYLYCDVHKSIDSFEKSLAISNKQTMVNSIIKIIKNTLTYVKKGETS